MSISQKEDGPPMSTGFSHWSEEGTQFMVPKLRHSFFFHNKGVCLNMTKSYISLPRELVNSYAVTMSRGLKNLWLLRAQTVQGYLQELKLFGMEPGSKLSGFDRNKAWQGQKDNWEQWSRMIAIVEE